RLLPPTIPEIPGEMTLVLMYIVEPEIIIIGPFVIVPPLERQKEIIFLYKLQLLPRDIRFLLIRHPEIFLRKTIDRFIIDRVGAAHKVFPFLVLKTIGT